MAHSTANTAAPARNPAMDYKEHDRTYAGFIKGVKWGTYFFAALMIILYFLIIH